ncbi:MAG: peptidyl-prolyl cis-trans isomerase [Chloroflexia bacterium]|nr:peptidyl-prolyl cis-trans isomerase [Chloroflexia bacterium]
MSFTRGHSALTARVPGWDRLSLVILLITSMLLVACGGGGDAEPTETTAPVSGTVAIAGDPTPADNTAPTSADAEPGIGTEEVPPSAEATDSVQAPSGAGTPEATAEVDRSKPAAVVNGEEITFEALDAQLEQRYGAQEIERLIVESLVRQEAEKRKVTATEAEIDAELTKARLSTQAQGQNLDQVITQQFGSLDAFREQLRLNLYVQKIIGPQVQVTDKAVQDYYNQNKQQFSTPEELQVWRVVADDQAKATAAAKELRGGAKLDAVIKKHGSKKPNLAEQNADLGYTQVQQLPPDVAMAAANLRPGQVADPAPTQDGAFSVLKVVARRGGQAKPLTAVRPQVETAVREAGISERVQGLLTELRAKAKIETQFKLPQAQPPAGVPEEQPAPGEPAPEGTPQG